MKYRCGSGSQRFCTDTKKESGIATANFDGFVV